MRITTVLNKLLDLPGLWVRGVRFFWGTSAIGSITLEWPGWREVILDVPAALRDPDPEPPHLDVLSLFVSCTWNPHLWNLDLARILGRARATPPTSAT